MNPVEIARVCHDANRAYCKTQGDDTQLAWEFAPQWQKDSAVAGVEYHLANPQATNADMHESWSQHKRADGWVYGATKDAAAKTHPCLVPYDQLPLEQQRKDALFSAIVKALTGT